MIPECTHISYGRDENETVEKAAEHILNDHKDMLDELEGGDIERIKPNLKYLVSDTD